MKKKIVIIAIISVIAICGIGGAVWIGTFNMRTYHQATSAYNNGRYNEALTLFKKISDYKDSSKWIDQTVHQIDVENDTTPPEIELTADVLRYTVGDNIDIQSWLDDGNITVTDNITQNPDYTITGNDINTDAPSDYTVTITTQDEAGNTNSINLLVSVIEEETDVEIAYENATNLYPFLLDDEGWGSYSFDGIHIISDEISWLNEPWVDANTCLNPGALYKSVAMSLEGFYIDSMWGNWKHNVPNIFDFDAPDTWEEMKPYVDDAATYITSEKYGQAILTRLIQSSQITGDCDVDNMVYNLQIADVTALASELHLNQKMLGYVLAALDDYGGASEFRGKTCVLSHS